MTPQSPTAVATERLKEIATKLRSVGAILASERMQGWANPLVCDITDAADLIDPPANVTPGVVVSEPLRSPLQDSQVDGRDIFECANQLEGYVGPDTPEPLARFLLREGKGAASLAHEIVRLRSSTPSVELEARIAELEGALTEINGIRNSIIGLQTMNWSEHIYPLVAALEKAGIKGMGYDAARPNFGTMLERTAAAEARAEAAESALSTAEARGLERAAKIADRAVEHFAAKQADAKSRKAKVEARDFESMRFAAVQIADGIRASALSTNEAGE